MIGTKQFVDFKMISSMNQLDAHSIVKRILFLFAATKIGLNKCDVTLNIN